MKKTLAILLALVMVLSMAACGSSNTNSSSSSSTASTDSSSSAPADTTPADTSAPADSSAEPAGEESYLIGICQLAPHPALDAATEGFKDALVEKLGDNVKFDEGNASGDSALCPTIVDGFVAEGVDLILANATAPLQAAASATRTTIASDDLLLNIVLTDENIGITKNTFIVIALRSVSPYR